MRNLSKDSLETKETFLKLELVRAVHASRNIKHAGNFRKDYLLGAELQEHILRFSEIKYVWRYSVAIVDMPKPDDELLKCIDVEEIKTMVTEYFKNTI